MSRRVVLVVACAVAALATGAVGVAGAQQPESRPVAAGIEYQCTQPAVPVSLRVTATLPGQATANRPIELADLTLELTVPPAAVADLTGAVTATAVVRMETTVGQGDKTATTTWGTAQDAPVPVGDPTVFAGPVQPEPVTAGIGDLSFVAGPLVASITGLTADGAATDPTAVTLSCVPAPDQDLVLGVVPVVAPARGSVPAPRDDPGAGPGVVVGEKKSAPPPLAALGDVPPECHPIEPPPDVVAHQNYCANMAGYTNVNGLDGSVLQPPGLLNIAAGNPKPNCEAPRRFCQQARALPNLNGEPKYPPAPGSFYAWGIIPTTATMELTQIGPATVDLWFTATLPYQGEAIAKIKLSARVFDATVNGVPLDLGPNCRTATPIDAELRAVYPTYSITQGGVLQGFVDIPELTGCGVTEDLDNILSRLVSGERNYVKMTQGVVCALSNAYGCPPNIPTPQR
jgi:hypothetical protein